MSTAEKVVQHTGIETATEPCSYLKHKRTRERILVLSRRRKLASFRSLKASEVCPVAVLLVLQLHPAQ